jgi:hypothetical protein
MAMKWGLALAGAILVAAATAAAARPPAVYSAWKTSKLSSRECMAHASTVLRRNSFSSEPVGDGVTIIGARGEFSALLRCALGADDPGFVAFFVAGPEKQTTLDYLTGLWNGF